MNNNTFIQELKAKLRQFYEYPNVLGGHDVVHVEGVEKLGKKILPHMSEVDPAEYEVTAWLHNLDRCLILNEVIQESGGLANYAFSLLAQSQFSQEAQGRIVGAVMQHPKKDDDLKNDSPLLTAIRIADKLDRLTPINIMAGPKHRPDLQYYNAENPFDYQHNKPNHLKYFLWNLEWYGMLPYAWARELVDKSYFKLFLNFLRELGRDIAERHGIENRIEDEIKNALGMYYLEWK